MRASSQRPPRRTRRDPLPAESSRAFSAAELWEGVRGAVGHADALVVVPPDAPAPAGARVMRGTHPLPGAESLEAGEALLSAARSLRPVDAALLLISGGGSALAEAPQPGLSLADVREVNQ